VLLKLLLSGKKENGHASVRRLRTKQKRSRGGGRGTVKGPAKKNTVWGTQDEVRSMEKGESPRRRGRSGTYESPRWKFGGEKVGGLTVD